MRSRIVSGAVAAGMVAGLLAVGTGSSSAQTNLVTCDRVIGTGTITPGLTNQSLEQTIGVKGAKLYSAPCTGVLAGALGITQGTKVGGKFTTDPDTKNPGVTGGFSCDSAAVGPVSPYPPYGKIKVTYDVIDPFTLKPYATQSFIRLGSDPVALDAATVTGIAIKGVGVGGDVTGGFLQQPVSTVAFGATLAYPSTLDTTPGAGQVVPGISPDPLNPTPWVPAGPGTGDSLGAGLGCIIGASALNGIVFGTDGTSLVGSGFDSNIAVSFP